MIQTLILPTYDDPTEFNGKKTICEQSGCDNEADYFDDMCIECREEIENEKTRYDIEDN